MRRDRCLSVCVCVQSNLLVVDGVVHKIRRQIEDLERDGGGADSGAPTVDGVPVESYLSRSVQRLAFSSRPFVIS